MGIVDGRGATSGAGRRDCCIQNQQLAPILVQRAFAAIGAIATSATSRADAASQ